MSESQTAVKRVAWGMMGGGIVASIIGNILYIEGFEGVDSVVARIISAIPSIAFLGAMWLLERMPWARSVKVFAALAGLALLGGIAGWLSFWHLADVAYRYGQKDGAQFMIPLAIDGAIIVGSMMVLVVKDALAVKPAPDPAPLVVEAVIEAPAPTPAPVERHEEREAIEEITETETKTRTIKRTARTSITTEQRDQVIDLIKNTSLTPTAIAGQVFGAGTHPNKIKRDAQFAELLELRG